MKLTLIYSNENARIEASPEDKYIQVTWLEHTSGTPLKDVLLTALQYALSEGIFLWLYDMRKINYTTVADQAWTLKEFFPAFDAQLQYRLACVARPENVEMLPDALIQEAIDHDPVLYKNIKMKILLDMELAKYWLFH
ncbi:hypothetical protein ACMA1I_08415 [Pontibacter sp. 13R65]|uniref:hypothetical protein n=1 Tax=Pontibacter sp. 13R65 TaxID=3127458 RepID=UPI00301E096B